MYRYKFLILVTLIFFTTIALFALASTINNKLFVVVSSYDPINPCGELQLEGIIKGIKEDYGKDARIRVLYMLSRSKNITCYAKEATAKEIINRVKQLNPDGIYITDDAAFEYVGIPLIKKHVKFCFSGTNIPISVYKSREPILRRKRLCGVEEVVSAELLKKFIHHAGLRIRRIYVIYDGINMFNYYVEQEVRRAFTDTDIQSVLIQNKYQLSNFFRNTPLENCIVIMLTLSLNDTNDYYEIVSIAKQNNTHRAMIVSISETCICKSDIVLTTDFRDMGYSCYRNFFTNSTKLTKSKPKLLINLSSSLFSNKVSFIRNLDYVQKIECRDWGFNYA